MNKELELRAGNTIKAILQSELGDYSCYKHEITDIEEYGDRSYTVYFKVYDNEDILHDGAFRITFDDKLEEFDEEHFEQDCEIEIEIHEECYEKVETFDWTIKYFWMAILRD